MCLKIPQLSWWSVEGGQAFLFSFLVSRIKRERVSLRSLGSVVINPSSGSTIHSLAQSLKLVRTHSSSLARQKHLLGLESRSGAEHDLATLKGRAVGLCASNIVGWRCRHNRKRRDGACRTLKANTLLQGYSLHSKTSIFTYSKAEKVS